MNLKTLLNSTVALKLRSKIAKVREAIDPYYKIARLEAKVNALWVNAPYEFSPEKTWQPNILGLEETLKYVIDKKCSLARYGDGEFALMAGRNMSFEIANEEMQTRLREILSNPLPNCLNCVPNIFGSLTRYRDSDIDYWREAAVWMRPILKECLIKQKGGGVAQNAILGDPQISRAYLGVADKALAPRVFRLWKELFAGKDILIAEGRYSRLGIGNDLLSGARSVRRIWCPANGAFGKYEQIKDAIMRHSFAGESSLVLMALGATATILAYDLAKAGVWAIDAGHIDVEYMWMKMGVAEKCPIPSRYVNECINGGREMLKVFGEEAANNVVATIAL